MSRGKDMINENNLDPSDKIIIQITDTHLLADPSTEFVQVNPENGFHAVIEDILKHHKHIDAIIHTGDLVQVATPEAYQRYIDYMGKLNIPFFHIPGNHDVPAYFPFQSIEPTPTIVDLGQWQIVMLNSAIEGKVHGWIKSEQLEYLDQWLSLNQDKYVLLAFHHHPFPVHSKWVDFHILKNTSELTKVIEKYKNIKAAVFGHIHQESVTKWNNIDFYSTPSTFVQFKPLNEDFAFDEIEPGYRCLHLKPNGQFETEVKRVKGYMPKINKEISGY